MALVTVGTAADVPAEGELDGTHVECPCHMGVFDVVTGEVVAAPPSRAEPVYTVRTDGDELQVEM